MGEGANRVQDIFTSEERGKYETDDIGKQA